MKDMDENKKNLIKIALYGGFFLIVILVAAFSNRANVNTNKNGTNNSSAIDNQILDKVKEINENYYSSKVHFVMDDDAVSLEYQRINDVQMGVKKYHGERHEYTKYNGIYYKLDGDKFNRLSNFVDFDYDRTFMEITNIKKLLLLDGSSRTYINDDVNVLRVSYNLNDVLKIYNEFNNTNVIKYSDGDVILDIYYKDDEIMYFVVNITDLYNMINEKEYSNVKYKLEIESNKEEDTSWLTQKLN